MWLCAVENSGLDTVADAPHRYDCDVDVAVSLTQRRASSAQCNCPTSHRPVLVELMLETWTAAAQCDETATEIEFAAGVSSH